MNHKAILFSNSSEIRRVKNYTLIDLEMKVVDLPTGYQWKLMVEGVKPSYDANLERLICTETNTDDPHPDYPDFKAVVCNYVSERKSDNEIIQSIEALKQSANQILIEVNGQSEELQYLTLYALIRLQMGQSVPPAANAIRLKVEDIAQKIIANGVHAENLITQINNGQSPDINTGWIYE